MWLTLITLQSLDECTVAYISLGFDALHSRELMWPARPKFHVAGRLALATFRFGFSLNLVIS